MEKFWSRFILKLKKAHPFFATVALFSHFRFNESIDIAETKGREVSVSPKFFETISEDEQFSFLLHQILHLALRHPQRGVGRNETIWNIAADIVINHLIANNTAWPRPPKTAWDNRFPDQTVEHVYAVLLKQATQQAQSQGNSQCGAQGLQSSDSQDQSNSSNNLGSELAKFYNSHSDFRTSQNENYSRVEHEDTRYWRQAMRKAEQLHKHDKNKGSAPLGRSREFQKIDKARLDWRHLLWRYASDKRNDYSEFDHRHIHRGLYTEFLLNQGIRVAIGIDTSGSISPQELGIFVKEMQAISACHPETELFLYYIDVDIHGPYQFNKAIKDIPSPVGGGGTSFVPFFDKLKKHEEDNTFFDVVIYFTDGFGDFPKTEPRLPVLWVITEDGEEEEKFPFGQVIHIGCR